MEGGTRAAARHRRRRRRPRADSAGGSRRARARACLALDSCSGSCFSDGFGASHAALCCRSCSCFGHGLGGTHSRGGASHAAPCCRFCSCFGHGLGARGAAWAPSWRLSSNAPDATRGGFGPRGGDHSLAQVRGCCVGTAPGWPCPQPARLRARPQMQAQGVHAARIRRPSRSSPRPCLQRTRATARPLVLARTFASWWEDQVIALGRTERAFCWRQRAIREGGKRDGQRRTDA